MTANEIISYVRRRDYEPMKLKLLARKLAIGSSEYPKFRDLVKRLVNQGRLEYGQGRTIRQPDPHGTITGTFRGIRAGGGFVRPHLEEGTAWPDLFVAARNALDAATGDEVLVRVTQRPRAGRNPEGRIVEVLERATSQFVGTYLEEVGQGLVRVDGTIFQEPIFVGDPGAKGTQVGDKVVIEMVRFPSPGMRGEAVVTELLGPRGAPGVDTLSIIREFGLPDKFHADAQEDARQQTRAFRESDHTGRRDFTSESIVTVDPTDARDFDDAVHVHRLAGGGWQLGVHIADVTHFVRPGTALDREARKRGTSVYLPDRVLPMLPEVLSNGLASLQEGVVRYTKTALMEFSSEGTPLGAEIMPSVIRVTKRLDYETVMDCLKHPHKHQGRLSGEVRALLERMRKLASVLRERRRRRGFLELELPEVKLELDEKGRFVEAHLQAHDESHQIIEEFMLSANEAVAQHLEDRDLLFMRRVHGHPDPFKLRAFAEFVRAIGYKIQKPQSRSELQAVLAQSHSRPDRYAVHYGLLRSMKRAEYSPEELGHYAIASDCYCHFTSPIRRYPDLLVHRLLDRFWRDQKVSVDETELIALGEHCTFTERRAAQAESELIKLKVLTYLARKIGLEMDAVITSVEEFGFFAQSVKYLVDGMVHVSTLTEDYYRFDPATYCLEGRRTGRTYRLGDILTVRITRVDLDRRQLDFQVARRGDR